MKKHAKQFKHSFNKLVMWHFFVVFNSIFFVGTIHLSLIFFVFVACRYIKTEQYTPSSGLQKNKSKSRKIKWTMTLFRRFSIYTYLQHVIYFCGLHIAYHLMPSCPLTLCLVVHTRLRFCSSSYTYNTHTERTNVLAFISQQHSFLYIYQREQAQKFFIVFYLTVAVNIVHMYMIGICHSSMMFPFYRGEVNVSYTILLLEYRTVSFTFFFCNSCAH